MTDFNSLRKEMLLFYKLKCGTSYEITEHIFGIGNSPTTSANYWMITDFIDWLNGRNEPLDAWNQSSNINSIVNLFYRHLTRMRPNITKKEINLYLVSINLVERNIYE